MNYSFKRKKEVTGLYDLVMGRENIFLHGSTGIGKTYVLRLLKAKLDGRRVCFYRSLRGVISTQQYLHEFIKELKSVARDHSNLDYQLRRFLDENPVYQYESLPQLNAWFDKLTITLSQIGLDFLFMFDDINEWENDDELESVFSHLAILNQANNCQLLLTSNRNTAGEIAKIKFQSSHLTAVRKEKIWPNHMEDWQAKSYSFTDGNTSFLIELLEYCNQDEFNFHQASQRLMQDYHPVLSKMRKRFTKLQWKLLRSIAFEEIVEQPHSFEFLVKHKLGAASSVERALRNLHDTEMILKTEKGWKVSNMVYQRWLQWLYSK